MRDEKWKNNQDVLARFAELGYAGKNFKEISALLGRHKDYVITSLSRGDSPDDIVKKATPRHECGITFHSDAELSKILGRNSRFVGSQKKKGLSYKQIIEYSKNLDSPPIIGSYRGFSWTSGHDLSRQLGHDRGYVTLMKRARGYGPEDLIDMHLAKLEEQRQ